MKNKKIIYGLSALLLAAAIFSGFGFISQTNVEQNIQDKKLELVQHISYQELEQLLHSDKPNTDREGDCTMQDIDCCNPLDFCAVTMADFLAWSRNYRDSVWRYTSPYYYDNYPIDYDNDTYYHSTYNAGISPTGVSSPVVASRFDIQDLDGYGRAFDARFMDMDLGELQSYLCMVKNHDSLALVNTLRFYYTRYTDDIDTESFGRYGEYYKQKHSFVIVPVEKGAGTLKEYYMDSTAACLQYFFWDPAGCKGSTMNHSDLCPPPKGCPDGSYLSTEIDRVGPQ